MKLISCLLALLFIVGCSKQESNLAIQELIPKITSQMDYAILLAEKSADSIKISPRTFEKNQLRLVSAKDWTSGFFPGNLWQVYQLTKDAKWKQKALQFTIPLEKEKWNGGTHDMGFKMFCSFGKAYQFTGDTTYRNILIQSAKTLATRFNPKVGCIRSWDHNADKWDFPVIIDNMMNLELLMWASKETGNDTLRHIAVTHAQTTLKNHFRPDNSSYHVIDYDPETGFVEKKNTHQGYADESAWARGQAWGLYGFTMMYRETGMKEFLVQAEKIAQFLLAQPLIKEGKVPYWDFNAPNIPEEPLDASAGAIMASAFYELSDYSENGKQYKTIADHLLNTLATKQFLSEPGENGGFLLKHSTGHLPNGSEIDVPMVYADYYFLEALIRKGKNNKR